MSVTDAEVERVRQQWAREEYNRRAAVVLNKPSFLGWLSRVGLDFIVTKILAWLWTSIKAAFGLSLL